MNHVLTPKLYKDFNQQYSKCFNNDTEELLSVVGKEEIVKLADIAEELNEKYHVLLSEVKFIDKDNNLNVDNINILHRITK